MKEIIRKTFISGLILVTYFMVWRPVRIDITQHVVRPITQSIITSNGAAVGIESNPTGVAFGLTWPSESGVKQSIQYSPQAGFFFILALISLVFISGEPVHYVYLVGFHFISFLLIILFIVLGLYAFYPAFRAAELFITYLVPVFSMAYIPWILYMRKRNATS